MIKAVSVWLNAEGPLTGQSGTNNPFNIETTRAVAAQGSWYTFQKGWQQGVDSGSTVMFATFATPEDGARAAALNLQRVKGVGYEKVVTAARAGSPVTFLTALGQSSWAGGHYALNGVLGGKLLSAYGAPLTSTPATDSRPPAVTSNPVGSYPGPAPSVPGVADQYLSAWGGLVTFPVGYVVKAEDIPAIMAALRAGGMFNNDALGVGEFKTGEGLKQLVGQPWTADNLKLLQGAFGAAASQTPGTNIPAVSDITGLGSTLSSVATYLAALFVVALGVFLYSKGGQVAPADQAS
jgi:hypothetical protein